MKRPKPAIPQPLTNGDGRGSDGRFIAGNSAARGRRTPQASTQEFRAALLGSIGVSGMERAGQKLMQMVLSGDIRALQLLIEQCVGKPLSVRPTDVESFEADPDESFL